jgi:hypothetical protein
MVFTPWVVKKANSKSFAYTSAAILQGATFWMNLKETFFPYYIIWLGMLFLVVL